MMTFINKWNFRLPLTALLLLNILASCGDKKATETGNSDTAGAGQNTLSVDKLNELIQADPQNSQLYYERALAYYDLGDLTMALKDFNKTVELEPDFASAFNDRGICHFELMQFRESLSDFNQAIKLDPEYSEAYFNRSLVWDELGETGKALSDLDKAIALDPDFGDAYYNRAVYRLNSDRAKACQDFKKAAELGIKEAELTYREYCKP